MKNKHIVAVHWRERQYIYSFYILWNDRTWDEFETCGDARTSINGKSVKEFYGFNKLVGCHKDYAYVMNHINAKEKEVRKACFEQYSIQDFIKNKL